MKSATADMHIQREPEAGKGFVCRRARFASEQYGGTAVKGPVVRIGTAPLSAEKVLTMCQKSGGTAGRFCASSCFAAVCCKRDGPFLFFGPTDTIDAHTVRDKERKYL